MKTCFRIIFMLVVVLALSGNFAFSQTKQSQTDTVKVYENIESFSVKHKFTKMMYHLLFKPVESSPASKKNKKKAYPKLKQKPYSTFEGKIIRSINIVTLDPFGYSIADTIVRAPSFVTKAGNGLHVKSQHITIRNLLLFRQNQVFDSLLVKESERLVRSSAFVQDVSFYILATKKNSDSVDVFIRELDNWSIVPAGAFSASQVALSLKDRNLAGLGHEAKVGYTWVHTTGKYAYNLTYFVPNIRNTYITAGIRYGTDESGNFARGFAIDRPFFSPYAKWMGGINISWQLSNLYIHKEDSLLTLQKFKFNTQDYWLGKATQIFKGNSERDRTTNFITALRYLRVCYLEKPEEIYDKQHYFANEEFYLVSLGISTRNYVQDKYIFKFGLTEDVPIGKVYSITGGYQVKNNAGRLYLGARATSGDYYQWGYLGFNAEYGTFLHSSHAEQGVFTAGINYFTKLVEIGKWKFRQFVKPQIIIGLNQFDYDSITLNDGYGLDGFNSSSLSGNRRMIVTVQTQAYAPWNFIGFRFGPYFSLSLGMLGDASSGFHNSRMYSKIGLGVLIKNDHLVINTFEISVAYYPTIPGNGDNIFKFNSFKTTDFGFRDFEMGKPAVVVFQ